MSAFTVEAAQIERGTAIHRHTSARMLSIYHQTSAADGLDDNCFAASGDMLAVLNRDTPTRVTHRRSIAASVAYAGDTGASQNDGGTPR